MKKVFLILAVALICVSSAFAIDYSKNHVTFVVDPFVADWVVPVNPSEKNNSSLSKYGAGAEISYQFNESEQFGLELVGKFTGFTFDWFDEGRRPKYVFGAFAKAVVTAPLSDKVAFMVKGGIGMELVSFYTSRNWHFAFGVDADLSYAFDDTLAWLVGVGFDMDFSKSVLDWGLTTSRYLSVKTGVVAYL